MKYMIIGLVGFTVLSWSAIACAIGLSYVDGRNPASMLLMLGAAGFGAMSVVWLRAAISLAIENKDG